MPKITYVEASGTEHTIEVAPGVSLMEGAVASAIPGIDGDCGGLCACATCHVYIRDNWRDRVNEAQELETGMLDFAFGVDGDSRLACQIKVSPELDGLIVHMPDRQY